MGNAETFSDALRECMGQLGGVRTKAEIDSWIKAHYPNRWKLGTLNGHLYGCCVNNPKGIEHHPSFSRFLFTHGNSRYELYDPQKHGAYDESGLPAGEHPEPELVDDNVARAGNQNGDGGTAFAYEAHLRDYLAGNLEILEAGLSLWETAESSVEYPINGRRIDILAKDQSGLPVVVELKVSRGHERTIGQCLYYREALKDALGVEAVRIFIVAEEISTELRLATRAVPDVVLFDYSLSMTVNRI